MSHQQEQKKLSFHCGYKLFNIKSFWQFGFRAVCPSDWLIIDSEQAGIYITVSFIIWKFFLILFLFNSRKTSRFALKWHFPHLFFPQHASTWGRHLPLQEPLTFFKIKREKEGEEKREIWKYFLFGKALQKSEDFLQDRQKKNKNGGTQNKYRIKK